LQVRIVKLEPVGRKFEKKFAYRGLTRILHRG